MVFKIFLIAFCLILPFAVQGASSIDINTAPLEELEKIIGIGPMLTQRIIEARPFDSLDDLIKVKGIGKITLQKIKDQGLAWVGPQEELEPKPKPEPLPTKAPSGAEEREPKPTKLQTPITYPIGIVFNEILPSPDGPDAENEWIELYNQNDFDVDLSGWTIKDTTGSAKTYTLNAKIPANGYLVLLRPETKITLNNSGDGLNLINPNKEIVDSVDFGKASLGQSYSKTSSGWTWNSSLTPGERNVISVKEVSSTNKTIKKQKELSEGKPLTAESANINLLTQKSKPPVWLIAFILAIFSGIAILILKNSLF